ADLRGWLRESREDLGLSIDWADAQKLHSTTLQAYSDGSAQPETALERAFNAYAVVIRTEHPLGESSNDDGSEEALPEVLMQLHEDHASLQRARIAHGFRMAIQDLEKSLTSVSDNGFSGPFSVDATSGSLENGYGLLEQRLTLLASLSQDAYDAASILECGKSDELASLQKELDGTGEALVTAWVEAAEIKAADVWQNRGGAVQRVVSKGWSAVQEAFGQESNALSPQAWTRLCQEQSNQYYSSLLGLSKVDFVEGDQFKGLGGGLSQDRLPRTQASVVQLNRDLEVTYEKLRASQGEGSPWNRRLQLLGELAFTSEFDFGEKRGAWFDAPDSNWSKRLDEQVKAVLKEMEEASGRDDGARRFAHPHAYLGTLVQSSAKAISKGVLADMQHSYGELRNASGQLGFPFGASGGIRKISDASQFNALLGSGGRLDEFVSAFDALGLCPYVPPPIQSNGARVDSRPAFMDGRPNERVLETVSRLRDLADFYRQGALEDERRLIRLTRESGDDSRTDEEINKKVPTISIGTSQSVLGQYPKTDGPASVVHLSDRNPQGMLSSNHRPSGFFVKLTSALRNADVIEGLRLLGTDFEALDTGDPEELQATAETVLSYPGTFGILLAFADAEQTDSGVKDNSVYFDYGLDDGSIRSTSVQFPLNIQQTGSGRGQSSASYQIYLTATFEGVWVPKVPIEFENW
ncbi:MAG: hypothetical protein AAGG01_17570, partial [Planctomycetota bacterium]